MALKELIDKQTIVIDDHKRGSREIKNWDDIRNDIHIDKTTNFPLGGRIQRVRIRIPINSERPISIESERNTAIDGIPKKLEREIKKALEDKETRTSFVQEVMEVLKDFKTALSNEQRANQVLTNISKHFDLNWPTETIKNYVNDVLHSYTLVYKEDNTGKEFFSRLDSEKIEIGQYSGYAKQTRKLNR